MEDRKRALYLFGYRFFYVFLLCAVFYLCMGGRLPLREMMYLHLFILAVLSAGISAADSLRSRNYLYGFIVFLGIYALVLFGRGASVKNTTEVSGVIFRETFYLMTLVLGVYLCHLLAEKLVWISRAAAVLLPGALVTTMVCRWEVSHLGVAAVLLYTAAVVTEWVESGWKKQKQGSSPAYLLWLSPFLAGYFVLMALMPYREKPYDWALFVDLYHRAQRKTAILTENLIRFGSEDFEISTTGFSEDGLFFGDLGKKDKVVIRLENPGQFTESIYLTGRIYDSFDGRQWEQHVQGSDRDPYLDALTTLCAVYGYDPEYPQDYMRQRTVGVQYEHFHTTYLFAPVKTCRIRPTDPKLQIDQQGGGFRFVKKQGRGTDYQVNYTQLNLGNPVFDELVLCGATAPSQETLEKALNVIPGLRGMVSLEDLAEYGERVKRDYTESIALSPEAETFLRETVADANTDYEKLLCLESALRSFSYNEKPGKLPSDVDTKEKFLDYFLVNSREGYCSYYASAFVLLARAEGIPARYVQGFVTPQDGQKSREVVNSMAHAWPEAWIDGVGWIPFEPTPGFETRRKVSWEPQKREEEPEQAKPEKGSARKPENSNTTAEESAAEESAQDLEEQLREAERARKREILIFLGYFLLLILSLGVLLFLADALLEKKREGKRSPEEGFRVEALRNLQILAVLGYRRREAETLAELQDRLADKRIEGMETFVALCEEVLYGESLPDEGALAFLLQMRENLLKELRREKGKAYVLSKIGLYLARAR